MSAYADLGTAAHSVLEQCLTNRYTWGMPVSPYDWVGQEIQIQDKEHAELSHSKADRWMTCSGSRKMERPFREAEKLSKPRSVIFDRDYADAVEEILNYIEARCREAGFTQVLTERKVTLFPFLSTDVCDGTLDVALIGEHHVEIIDAKFGAGVAVDPSTRQLDMNLLGLLGTMPDRSFETATLTIAQPRCWQIAPKIRSREIEAVEKWRESFVDECRSALARTEEKSPPFAPSEKACRFCLARGVCTAATEHGLNEATVLSGHMPITAEEAFDAFQGFALLDPERLSDERILAILNGASFLRATLRAVEKYALQALLEEHVSSKIAERYQIQRSLGNRVWALPEDEIEKKLKRIKIDDADSGKIRSLGKKDLTETRLKSVKTIETLLKNLGIPDKDARFDAFRALVVRPEGEPKLVPRIPAVGTVPDIAAPTQP